MFLSIIWREKAFRTTVLPIYLFDYVSTVYDMFNILLIFGNLLGRGLLFKMDPRLEVWNSFVCVYVCEWHNSLLHGKVWKAHNLSFIFGAKYYFFLLLNRILLILFPSSILWGNCLDQEETPWRDYRKKQVLKCLSWAKDQWEIKQRYWTLNMIFNTYRRLPVTLRAMFTSTSALFSHCFVRFSPSGTTLLHSCSIPLFS